MGEAFNRVCAAFRDNGLAVIDKGGDRADAQAPGHSGADRSVSIRSIEDRVLVNCHAGEQLDDVLAAVGLQMRDLFDNPKGSTYSYPDGRQVHRSPDKKFRQSGNTQGRSLFRADRLADAETVYVVEGEQDVLAIESAGGTAVCSAMGAGKAHLFDWEPLRGKQVVIVADRDEPGRRHANDVADLLRGIAEMVSIVEAAEGKDAADHVAAGKTLGEFVYNDVDGADLLDDIESWFRRFICVTDNSDLALLSVWTVHTHLVTELRTTPRLQLDSTLPESGKTTVLDHLSRLCWRPILVASPPSPALIPRLLEHEIRTIELDEVDRVLRPDGAATPDLLSIINSGYRLGATRPALVPVKGGGWEAKEMPTFSPVVLSGNAPMLPDDTRSRIIRILLMPDYDNSTEDSDWEEIEADAAQLHDRIVAFADSVRDRVSGMAVQLPEGCVRRSREKWRPLKRVAVAAGGRWPDVVDALIERSLSEDKAERDAGLRTLPPGMVLLTDLRHVWPQTDDLVPTGDLVGLLIRHNPDYWGLGSPYGKVLTATRFGKLLSQAAKVTSQRPGGRGPRGYFRSQVAPVWSRLRIDQLTEQPGAPPSAPGAPGDAGYPGADLHRDNHGNQLHRVEPGAPPKPVSAPLVSGPDRCETCSFHIPTQGHRDGCPHTEENHAFEIVPAPYDEAVGK